MQADLQFEAPQHLGGPPFDHDLYRGAIDDVRKVLVESINTYWEKAARADPLMKKIKPVCLALFREDNPDPVCNPYDIVCRNPPPQYTMGHLALYNELVPAWVLYCNRASALLEVVEKAALESSK